MTQTEKLIERWLPGSAYARALDSDWTIVGDTDVVEKAAEDISKLATMLNLAMEGLECREQSCGLKCADMNAAAWANGQPEWCKPCRTRAAIEAEAER